MGHIIISGWDIQYPYFESHPTPIKWSTNGHVEKNTNVLRHNDHMWPHDYTCLQSRGDFLSIVPISCATTTHTCTGFQRWTMWQKVDGSSTMPTKDDVAPFGCNYRIKTKFGWSPLFILFRYHDARSRNRWKLKIDRAGQVYASVH